MQMTIIPCPIGWHKNHRHINYLYNGKLSCFFQGFCTFLLRRMASERQMRQRVFCGRMTSSIKPRDAATKGEANFSLVIVDELLLLVFAFEFAAEDDFDRAFGAHHGDFGGWPRIVESPRRCLLLITS